MAGEKKRIEKKTWAAYRNQSQAILKKAVALAADARALASEGDVDAMAGADALSTELASWQTALEPIAAELRGLLARLEPEQRRALDSLDQQLARELKKLGHGVHGEGSLLIVDGIVHVEIDSKKRSVTVNGVPGTELAVTALVSIIKNEFDRLRKAQTPPGQLLEKLSAAYDLELRASARTAGSQVETAAIHFQLALLRQSPGFRSNPTARSFREYPREQFRADLHALIASGEHVFKKRRFKFASGSDTAGAVFMLVPTLGRTAHVGRMWFDTVA